MAGRRPVTSQSEIPPLCKCGCGQPVKRLRRWWGDYLRNHQPKDMITPEGRKILSDKMRINNPMSNPAIAARVGNATRGKPRLFTKEHRENVGRACRERMSGPGNPMKNPEIARRVHTKNLQRQEISKNEMAFLEWATRMALPIIRVADGFTWINRRNSDFRVIGQKKVIEVTQAGCFNAGRRIVRNWMTYGTPTIEHYERSGWSCLVVFLRTYPTFPPLLLATVKEFIDPSHRWSGIWSFDELILSSPSKQKRKSTTSGVHPRKPT